MFTKMDVVEHTFHSSIQEAEILELCEFQDSQCYTKKQCLAKPNKTKLGPLHEKEHSEKAEEKMGE